MGTLERAETHARWHLSALLRTSWRRSSVLALIAVSLALASAACSSVGSKRSSSAAEGEQAPRMANGDRSSFPTARIERAERTRPPSVAMAAPSADRQESGAIEEITVSASRRSPASDSGSSTPLEPAAGPSRSAEEIFGEVDAVVGSLPWASAVFDVPRAMKQGDHARARLAISVPESIGVLESRLREVLGEKAEPVSARVQISDVMLVKLEASAGLGVRAQSELKRSISKTGVEEWAWELEAKEAGEQSLHLELYALFDVQGEERPKLLKTWDVTIPVKVAPIRAVLGFVNEHYEWLWGAILVPIWPIVARWWKGKAQPRERRRVK